MENMTPGWNDPPLMATSPVNARPRNLLNKRVAYPLTKPETVEANHMTPPSLSIPLPTNQQIPTEIGTVVSDESNNLDSLTTVLDILNNLVAGIQNESKKVEISKRLIIMKNMWEENKLTAQIHNEVLELATCLKSGEFDKANDIYMSVSVNCAAMCSSWMLGIKYIIHHCKSS